MYHDALSSSKCFASHLGGKAEFTVVGQLPSHAPMQNRARVMLALLVASTKLLHMDSVSTGMGDLSRVQIQVHESVSRYVISQPGQLSLAIPPWVSATSTSQWAVTLCGWGVKAGMARVWRQVKLCDPLVKNI